MNDLYTYMYIGDRVIKFGSWECFWQEIAVAGDNEFWLIHFKVMRRAYINLHMTLRQAIDIWACKTGHRGFLNQRIDMVVVDFISRSLGGYVLAFI